MGGVRTKCGQGVVLPPSLWLFMYYNPCEENQTNFELRVALIGFPQPGQGLGVHPCQQRFSKITHDTSRECNTRDNDEYQSVKQGEFSKYV